MKLSTLVSQSNTLVWSWDIIAIFPSSSLYQLYRPMNVGMSIVLWIRWVICKSKMFNEGVLEHCTLMTLAVESLQLVQSCDPGSTPSCRTSALVFIPLPSLSSPHCSHLAVHFWRKKYINQHKDIHRLTFPQPTSRWSTGRWAEILTNIEIYTRMDVLGRLWYNSVYRKVLRFFNH